MSCSPGSPCYNTSTNCAGDPCNPNGSVSCETVIYNGPALPNTGIDTCTNLCVALQEIDNTINQILTGSNITASNGLSKVVNDIRLGGPLTQSTTIATGPYDLILTGIDTGSSSDSLLVLTAGGVVKKVAASALAPTITLTPNSGLEWNNAPTNSELKTLYNTLVPDAAISVPVGGAVSHPASYWKTKTFVEIFDEILFPTQLPTYTIPTVGITGITGGTYEVGQVLSLNATITANKWDAGAFTILRMFKTVNGGSPTTSTPSITATTGAAFGTQFTFADPNSPNIQYTGTYTESLTIPAPASGSSSTVTYQANGDHAAGLPKLTSLNAADTRTAACDTTSAPQSACTTSSSVITLTGLYPIFYGAIDNGLAHDASGIANDIQTGNTSTRTVTKSLVSGTPTITAAFGNKSQKWFWIAVPASYTAKTTYKTVWNNIFDALGPSGAWDIISASQNVTTALWSSIPYRIYRTNYVTDTTGDIQIY